MRSWAAFYISWRVTKSFTRFFFAFLRFLWRGQGVTFVKLLFTERYKWQTSYRTCIKFVLEKSAFSTLLIFSFISCEVGRCTQPGAWHLTNPLMKRLATKKDLGLFKIDRAVVDSNRSVNLPLDIRKILCTYPRKRKDIRGLPIFQIGDLSSKDKYHWYWTERLHKVLGSLYR